MHFVGLYCVIMLQGAVQKNVGNVPLEVCVGTAE